MFLSDVVLIPLLVIGIPMGFVWVTRRNASMHRDMKLLVWSVPFGALALASLLAARGGVPCGGCAIGGVLGICVHWINSRLLVNPDGYCFPAAEAKKSAGADLAKGN